MTQEKKLVGTCKTNANIHLHDGRFIPMDSKIQFDPDQPLSEGLFVTKEIIGGSIQLMSVSLFDDKPYLKPAGTDVEPFELHQGIQVLGKAMSFSVRL